MLNELPPDMDGISKTQAATHLFHFNNEENKLAEQKPQLFHLLVSKLLYLC